MIRSIIIEDENPSQELLKSIISHYCPQVSVVGIANDVKSGLDLFLRESPDLAFMDIQLADENSYDILDKLPAKKCKIIFTTAYEKYALKAFKYDAMDYILKPFSHLDIMRAVEKIKSDDINETVLQQLNSLLRINEKAVDKIKIQTYSGIFIIKISDIIRIEADGAYSIIYTLNGKKCMTSKPLKDYEMQLSTAGFYRTHTSHLINISHISQIRTED